MNPVTCGECLHIDACSIWNAGSLKNTNAKSCATFCYTRESVAYYIGFRDGKEEQARIDEGTYDQLMYQKYCDGYNDGLEALKYTDGRELYAKGFKDGAESVKMSEDDAIDRLSYSEFLRDIKETEYKRGKEDGEREVYNNFEDGFSESGEAWSCYHQGFCDGLAESKKKIEELQQKWRSAEVDAVNLTGWLAEEYAKHLWRSVDDSLPERKNPEYVRDYYLVCLESGCVQTLAYEFDDVPNAIFKQGWHKTASPVKYWMPLPETPIDVKEEA